MSSAAPRANKRSPIRVGSCGGVFQTSPFTGWMSKCPYTRTGRFVRSGFLPLRGDDRECFVELEHTRALETQRLEIALDPGSELAHVLRVGRVAEIEGTRR
jgi:hypothetical protein